jgi:hypothetical protein
MRTARIILTLVAILAATSLLPTDAQAQATRTWVSGVGDDANPCSRTAPCKTYAGAISKTAAGGEISTLDPGGFGAVTITKSITISGDGTLAGILNASVNGIIINALTTDKVILRNLSINGAGATGSGINGIRYLAAGEVVVDGLTISGCTNNGIEMALTATTGFLYVRNTRITRCATGIAVSTTSGVAAATLDNVNVQHMTNGVSVGANGRVTVRNSTLSGNTSNGLVLTAGTSIANAFGNLFSFNGVGVNANASGASARISGNGFFNNSTGIAFAAGGQISSDATNVFGGNSANGGPPNGAALLKQ